MKPGKSPPCTKNNLAPYINDEGEKSYTKQCFFSAHASWEVKMQCLRPGQGYCISQQLPGDIDAADPLSTKVQYPM